MTEIESKKLVVTRAVSEVPGASAREKARIRGRYLEALATGKTIEEASAIANGHVSAPEITPGRDLDIGAGLDDAGGDQGIILAGTATIGSVIASTDGDEGEGQPQEQSADQPAEQDEKDVLIAQLKELGVNRDRRANVETLQKLLDKARAGDQ